MKYQEIFLKIKKFLSRKYQDWKIAEKSENLMVLLKKVPPYLKDAYQWSKENLKPLFRSEGKFIQWSLRFLKKVEKLIVQKIWKNISFALKKGFRNFILWYKTVQITVKIIHFALRFKAWIKPFAGKTGSMIRHIIGRTFFFIVKGTQILWIYLKKIFLFLKETGFYVFKNVNLYLKKTFPVVFAKIESWFNRSYLWLKRNLVSTGCFLCKIAKVGFYLLGNLAHWSFSNLLKKNVSFLLRLIQGFKRISFFAGAGNFFRVFKIIVPICRRLLRKLRNKMLFLRRLIRFFAKIFFKTGSTFTKIAYGLEIFFLKSYRFLQAGVFCTKKALKFTFLFFKKEIWVQGFLCRLILNTAQKISRFILKLYQKTLRFFSICKISLSWALSGLRRTVSFYQRLRAINRNLYQAILIPLRFSVKTAKKLQWLYVWKKVSFFHFQTGFQRWKKGLHFNLNVFFKWQVRFLRFLVFTNWIKKGYQLAIFLVVSLTLFSFSKASLDWSNEKTAAHFAQLPPKEQQKVEKTHFKFYIDVADPVLRTSASSYLKDFEIISTKKDADGVVSDKAGSDFVSLMVEGTAVLTHKNSPVLNLELRQVNEILAGKILDWSAFGVKAKKLQVIYDPDSYLKPGGKADAVPVDKIYRILEQNDSVIAFVAVKNLIPSAKILTVNYHYPSKSEILLGQYPYGKYLVINLKEEVAHEREKIAQKISSDTLRSVVAGGDIMWDRGVFGQIKKYGTQMLIEDLIPYFKTGDISVVNLETSVSRRGDRYNIDKGIFFRSDPRYLNLLTDMKINLVSLANNHAFDYGMTAILDTIDYLDQKKIKYVGFGRDHSEAHIGLTYQFGGKKIRFIAYNTVYPNNVIATQYQPGIMMINPATLDSEIARAKKDVDYLIILMHSGEEYSYYPEPYKINLYRRMIDLGADIIVGSHPHVVQSFEYYKGKPIIYSVGNLIFDQYRFPKTRDEIVMEMNFYNGRLTYLFPHFFNVNSDYKPVLVKNKEVEQLLARMNKMKDDLPMIAKSNPGRDLKNNVPIYSSTPKKNAEQQPDSTRPPEKTDVGIGGKPVDSVKLEEEQYKEAEEKLPPIFNEEAKGAN